MNFNIKKYKGKYVMHCKTEEEAEIFCKYLHSIGRTWNTGASYFSESYWDRHKESMCYSFNDGTYCNKQYFEEARGYTILEMEDFMSKKEEVNCSNKTGIDHSKEVFKFLGLSPDEVFKVKSLSNEDYKITQDLKVYINVDRKYWIKSVYTIADFLNGTLDICKKPIPTEKEQLAINYVLACGYHWLAKDSDGAIYAYVKMPEKRLAEWGYSSIYSMGEKLEIGLPISFLSWEDDEPYYIGD